MRNKSAAISQRRVYGIVMVMMREAASVLCAIMVARAQVEVPSNQRYSDRIFSPAFVIWIRPSGDKYGDSSS